MNYATKKALIEGFGEQRIWTVLYTHCGDEDTDNGNTYAEAKGKADDINAGKDPFAEKASVVIKFQ